MYFGIYDYTHNYDFDFGNVCSYLVKLYAYFNLRYGAIMLINLSFMLPSKFCLPLIGFSIRVFFYYVTTTLD